MRDDGVDCTMLHAGICAGISSPQKHPPELSLHPRHWIQNLPFLSCHRCHHHCHTFHHPLQFQAVSSPASLVDANNCNWSLLRRNHAEDSFEKQFVRIDRPGFVETCGYYYCFRCRCRFFCGRGCDSISALLQRRKKNSRMGGTCIDLPTMEVPRVRGIPPRSAAPGWQRRHPGGPTMIQTGRFFSFCSCSSSWYWLVGNASKCSEFAGSGTAGARSKSSRVGRRTYVRKLVAYLELVSFSACM